MSFSKSTICFFFNSTIPTVFFLNLFTKDNLYWTKIIGAKMLVGMSTSKSGKCCSLENSIIDKNWMVKVVCSWHEKWTEFFVGDWKLLVQCCFLGRAFRLGYQKRSFKVPHASSVFFAEPSPTWEPIQIFPRTSLVLWPWCMSPSATLTLANDK